ncbi:MAG: thioredoxin domain-containing protein [Pseudomonadota bacterium]|nr:thioredoxin domain-containing protein [Pseudomonadota bacterium]
MFRLFATIAAIGAFVMGAMQISARVESSGWSDYDVAEFVMAQEKGKTIIVELYSDDCAACEQQAVTMSELRSALQDRDILFVKVDFEEQQEFVRDNAIDEPATILVFNGSDEVVRSVNQTGAEALRREVMNSI